MGEETKNGLYSVHVSGGIINVETKSKRSQFVDRAEFVISYVGA